MAMELPCASEVTTQNTMLPPLSRTFQNREDLINYVRDFGVSQGYVVTIKKSKKDRRVVLGCDRGGTYRTRRNVDELKRKRKSSSRLINCPFQAVGKRDDDAWVLTVKNGEHNHEPLKDMSEHRYSRRFTEEQVKQIKVMTEAGVKPLQVLKALKESNPDLHSTPRHLYNVKAKLRQGVSEEKFKLWRPNLSGTTAWRSASAFRVTNYIGGKFLNSQACEVIDVINPATQEVCSEVPKTTYEELKAAVVAAKQALPIWKNTPLSTRQRIMFKLQELIRRDIDKISMNITTEQGKTFTSAKAHVLYGLELVERACGMETLLMGNYVPNAANGTDTFCTKEPLGVCAGICLSDFPAMTPLWMFPVAVTCGNTFILKPSEKNPGVSMMIAALAAEAGLPDGVLNIVHGNHEITENICEDEDIKAISVTSSNNAGMDIYARVAARGKRIQSNIQMKNHIIIMPDASADAALDGILSSGFGVSGSQKFLAPSVAVFVRGSTQWEKELVERAKELKVNVGTEPGTDIGPVISKEAKNRICRLVESGICSGARLVLDGRHIVVPWYEQGNFLGPTILCDVTTSMDCYKEDMEGPVLLCMQAENLEEAIAIVNSSKLNTVASIFTSSSIAAREFQNEVETSLVGVNVSATLSIPPCVYNGSKISGDLDVSENADVHFYSRIKTVLQHWKELPRRQVPLTHPTSSETETSSQGISTLQLVSKAMPSATTETACEENSPIPGAFPSSSSIPETDLPRNEGSTRSPSTSTERFYVPTLPQRNESTNMLSFRHVENVVTTSQRSQATLQSTPDSDYSSVAQKSDNMSLATGSFNTTCTPNVVPTASTVPQLTGMYSASAVQRNDGALSSSSSERTFMPSTSQEMYVQTTKKSSVEDYHCQGVP